MASNKAKKDFVLLSAYILLVVFLTQITLTESSVLCSVGWPIQNRGSSDGGGWTAVSYDKPFTCNGQVAVWRYIPKYDKSFRVLVFKKIENSASQFRIIGINDIPAVPGSINTPLTYEVPVNERITVNAGDLIGWSGPAGIAWSGGGSFRVRFKGGGGHTAAGLQLNQVIDANTVNQHRQYSIEALVHHDIQAWLILCSAGWPVQNRVSKDGDGWTAVAYDKPFTCNGQIAAWHYYAKTAKAFRAIVFKKIEGSSTEFRIIGMNDIPAGAINTPVTYVVPVNERITVNAGDLLGWSGPGGIAWNHHGSFRVRLKDGLLADSLQLNQVLDANTLHQHREYSIEALVHAICSVGWPVQSRGGKDGDGWTAVAYDKPFTCNGQIAAWRYYAKSARAFRALVFRKIENSASEFRIIGINDIPAGAINTPVTYEVPEKERITVNKGDVIGWSSPGVISYNGGGSFRVRFTNAYSAASMQLNQVINANVLDQHRDYSIDAMVYRDSNTCYRENLPVPEFYTNPGVYGQNTLTKEECIEECFDYRNSKAFNYAGLRHGGGACLCSDTLDFMTNPNTECVTCPNDVPNQCGVDDFISVYQVPEPVEFNGIRFDVPDEIKLISATQSSTHGHYIAGMVIDGNMETSGYNFCAHTGSNYHQWVKVDMGTAHCVGKVVIWNREASAGRLKDAQIKIGDDSAGYTDPSCGTVNQAMINAGPIIEFTCNMEGRYITIYQPRRDYTHICEVKVSTGACYEAMCPDGYDSVFQRSCYKFNETDKMNREDAASACKADGGHLAIITSEEEQKFISTLLEDKNPSSSFVWIDLTVSDTKPIWSDGSAVSYKYWAPGQPNDDGTCVRYRKKWSDGGCTKDIPFLCEIEVENTGSLPYNTELPGHIYHDGAALGPYSIDYGDGYSESVEENRTVHVYRTPGQYPLQIKVTGSYDKVFTYRKMVNVEQAIDMTIECPEYVVRGQDFECKLTVKQGSNSTIYVERSPDPECYRDSKGLDYQGYKSVTSTGKVCQQWSSVLPHNHSFTKIGDHNFCRNPDEKPNGPWCYTMVSGTPWEYCDVVKSSKLCNVFDVPGNEIHYIGSDIDKLADAPAYTGSVNHNHLYMKIDDPVPYVGHVIGIEVVVATAGILEFRRYHPRPEYCDDKNLKDAPCVWKKKCSDGARYSFTKQHCYKDDGVIDKKPYDEKPYYDYNSDAKYMIDTRGKTGRLYFPIVNDEVTYAGTGYLFAYLRSTASYHGRLKVVAEERGDAHVLNSATIRLSSTMGVSKFQNLYRFLVRRVSHYHLVRVSFPMNWPLGVHDVKTTTTNGLTSDQNDATVILVDALYNVTLDVQEYAITNVSVALNATDYIDAFSFTWDFDDGTVLENGTSDVNYTWTRAGYYKISVKGIHPYGNKTFTKTIKVEDRIKGLQWTDSFHSSSASEFGIKPTVFGNDIKGYWYFTQGTDVSFEVNIFETNISNQAVVNFTLERPEDSWTENRTELESWTLENMRASYETNYFYLGCFINSTSDRILPIGPKTSVSMSPKMCTDHCLSLGMRFAGLQNAQDCYCGNQVVDVGMQSRADESSCNQTCAGDPGSKCGDELHNSIYELEVRSSHINVPLGMEEKSIADGWISSSTQKDTHYDHEARLNYKSDSWWPNPSEENHWIKVDLNLIRFVSGIITQGHGLIKDDGWVTKYSIEFSQYHTSTQIFDPVRNRSDDTMIFEGNFDSNTPVTRLFERPFRARHVKINPLEWHGNCRFRFELLGCELSEDTECYKDSRGKDYHGYRDRTRTNLPCQKWTSPNKDSITQEKYPDGGLGDHNYCRNPNNVEHPYCFVSTTSSRDWCGIDKSRSSCRNDVTMDGLLAIRSVTVSSFPMTIRAYNNISESTLYATVYTQKPVLNLRTTPTATTKFTDVGKISFFMDTGTNVTITIQSVDMDAPIMCDEDVLNGFCYIQSNVHFKNAGVYCFNITASNLVSTSTVVHCHTINHEIQDFKVNTSETIFTPPNEFSLFVDVLIASHCNISVDYGDGTEISSQFIELMDNITIGHVYNIAGSYLVQFHMQNDVSNATFEVMIHSQYPVDPLRIAPKDLSFPLLPSSSANVTFDLSHTGDKKPTAVTVNYTVTGVMNFNHVQRIWDNASYPLQETINISEYGTYVINWVAFNKLSSKNDTLTVEIDQPIQDLSIDPYLNPYGIVNESIPFNITVTWGSRITYTVTYDDGQEDVKFIDEGGHSLSHVWAKNAFYTVQVVAKNSLGSVTYTFPSKIEIVIPIEGIRLSARKLNIMPIKIPRLGEVPVHIFVNRKIKILPPDATVVVDFGDGKSNNNIEMAIIPFLSQMNEDNTLDTAQEKLGRTLTYFYTDPGLYNITLNISNVATRVSQTFDVFVYEEITDIAQFVKYTSAEVPDLGLPNATFDKDHFADDKLGTITVPLDKPTVLTASSKTGTGLGYTWNFDDGPDSIVETSVSRGAYWYRAPGEYSVSVNVSNPVDWAVHTVTKIAVESPVTYLKLLGMGPRPANTTFDFIIDISPGLTGTEVCYRIDFKDEETPINKIAFVGDRDSCERQYPDDFADAFIRFKETNTLQMWRDQKDGKEVVLNITNHFMTIGNFIIDITASNRVSSVTKQLLQVVLKPDCFPPHVFVDENNRCDSHVSCKSDGYRQFKASENVIVHSKIKNRCKTSKAVWFSWNVYKLGDKYDLEHLYNSKLNGTKLEGAALRDLTILGPIFEYGKYRFELNVSMTEEYGIYDVGETYIHITKSPLESQISGGYYRTSSWNSYDFVDGISNTYDPDQRGAASKEGFTFLWFCRRVKYTWRQVNGTVIIQNVESFEKWNDDFTEKLTNGTVNPEFVPREGDKLGCFGLTDSSNIPLPGGKIDQYGDRLNLNTSSMYYDMEYEIRMVVKKDTRLKVSVQTLLVLEGDPPNMLVYCKVNCGYKVNPSNRFAVETVEQFAAGGFFNLYYEWNIYILLNDTVPPIWGTTERSEWAQYSSTGFKKVNFVLNSGFFQDSKVYLLELRASRNQDGENPGIVASRLDMNDRPQNGTCFFDKIEGYAMQTEFNISCEGWTDEDQPLSYTFGLNSDTPGKPPTILHDNSSPFLLKPILIEQGLPRLNYTKSFFMKIIDGLGAFTKVDNVTIVVNPRPEQEIPQSVAEVVGALMGNVDELASEGEAGPMASLCSSMAGELNIDAAGSTESSVSATTASMVTTEVTTEGEEDSYVYNMGTTPIPKTPSEIKAEKRAARTELRKHLTKSIEKGASSVSDIGDVQQMLSATVKTTQEPTELSPEALTSVMNTLDSLLGFTSTIAGKASAENTEETINLVVESAGNCIDADLKGREDEINTQSLGSPAHRQRRSLDGDSQDSSDDSLLNNAEGMLDKCTDLILKQMVGGQTDMKVETSRATLVAGNTFLGELDDKTFDGGEGVGVTLPSVAGFFGNDTQPNCFLEQKIQITKRSTKIFSTGGTNVNSLTAKIGFTNGTSGEKMIVKNASEPITIVLTRNADNKLQNESDITPVYNITYPWGSQMFIHEEDVHENYAVRLDIFAVGQENIECDRTYKYSLYVLLRMNDVPSYLYHDHMCELKQEVRCYTEGEELQKLNETYTMNKLSSNEHVEPFRFGDGLVKSTGEFSCFYNRTFMNSWMENITQNSLNFGVRRTLDDVIDDNGKSKMKKKTVEATTAETVTFTPPLHYGALFQPMTCLAIGSEPADSAWKADGCEVQENSEPDRIVCKCNHLTTFGAGVKVPMNKINLKESAFTKLDENPVAFLFMLCCFCLYLIIIIWARKADQRDIIKAGVTPLQDNDPTHQFHYEITVFTGLKTGSGTSAKVSLILTGDAAESGVRALRDTKREIFARGGVDSFLMTCPEHLGSLVHARIWHDNKGLNPAWFLSRVMVKDLSNNRIFYFMLDRWLAVEEDDGQIERVIPVAGKSELTAFGHLFYTKTRRNLSDSHLWFSVFARPPKSRFTRVQRATCCMSLLFTTMMSNIFFYGVDFIDPSAAQRAYTIGPISFTMGEVVIGVISSLMVIPINLIIVQIFRLTKPKQRGVCCSKETGQSGSAYKATTVVPVVDEEDELQKQLDILEDEEIENGPIQSVSGDVARKETAVEMEPVIGYKKTVKKKKKFELPWGFLIVGWMLAIMTIMVASWMVIEVAGTFGKQKATEWLTSMMISCFQDILVTQPLKVLAIAMLVSLIFKDPEKEDADEPVAPQLQDDQEWLHKELTEEEVTDPKKLAELEMEGILREEDEDEQEKLDKDAVEIARQTRFKEMKMMSLVKEILFYLAFLNVTMLITLGERDEASYYINKSLQDMFVNADYHGKMQFNNILTKDQFWNYTENTFVPTLYDHTMYNGQTDTYADEHNVIADQNMYMLGQARLRQIRIEPESCTVHKDVEKLVPECRSYYNFLDAQENNFDEYWGALNESNPPDYKEGFKRAWQFRESSDLNSSALWGRYVVYPGSGYAIELGSSLGEANAVVSYLRDSTWIDKYTRAVLLEFVMYNPNLNQHCASALIVEMLPQGGASPFIFFWTTRIDRYSGSFAIFILAGQVLFGLFILYFTQHEVRQIIKEKRQYFKDPWNLAEIVTIALSISGMVFYVFRYMVGRSLMQDYVENKPAMVDFHSYAQWDQIYGYLVGFVLFIATLKFLRILRFNRRVVMFSMTLRFCSKDIGCYGIVFGIVFTAFTCSAYGIFHVEMKDFSTIVRTVESLFSTMLGAFNFDEMMMANRILGPLFFFMYVLLTVFILLNMFLSIINTSFSIVRRDVEAVKGEMEIVDFMVERFKRWAGFSEEKVKSEEKKFLYIEYIDPMDTAFDDLKIKLNDMVDDLNVHIKKMREEDKDYVYGDNYNYGSSDKKIFVSN